MLSGQRFIKAVRPKSIADSVNDAAPFGGKKETFLHHDSTANVILLLFFYIVYMARRNDNSETDRYFKFNRFEYKKKYKYIILGILY